MTSDSSATTPPRSGQVPKLIRFMLTIVIAAVLGPLIGGVAFFLVAVAVQIAGSEFDPGDIGPLMVLFFVGAYVVGGWIALMAGTIVAVVALWREPTFVIVVAAVVVANLISFVAIEGQPVASVNGLFIDLALSFFAAIVLWLIFRRYLRNP